MSANKWKPELIGNFWQQEAADEDELDVTRSSRAHFYGLWPSGAQETYLLIMNRFVTVGDDGHALFSWTHAPWRHQ